ncbi:hypothetical protein J8M21_19050 [Pseudoalteromonas luteoviolacea]|uniref:hypothetical protein n=1 Tax=Pseudoalteromonas luteoviolacea TaxID=43657 RepID=UPI001B3A277E|nr:hypothetical protein [Pseudoalteromonas luteoviolacea]MBQ4879314.1 hypothetical protein [Pseudoalteromonas luteoviolacea]MBQ4908374.1 hypothetical protein [Pseudoalteromonas luteoviolacea]
MSNLIESFKKFLAPGTEESKNAEIEVFAARDGSFHVDVESFKKSEAVQRQIAVLRESERKRA